jgi:hypothetical protein
LEKVAIDILGPLPKTKRGYQYILVVTYRYSTLTRAAHLRGVTAHEVAATFVDLWVASYCIPVFVLSDNGSQFTSKLFQRVAQIMKVTQLFSSAYHPSTNGQVERSNSTIPDKPRRYVDEEQNDGDDFVPPTTFAYNSQFHSSTGFSPFELVAPESAKHLTLKQAHLDTKTGMPTSKSAYRTALLRRVHEVSQIAKENPHEAQLRYKGAHDAHVKERNMWIQGWWLGVCEQDGSRARSLPRLSIPVDGPFQVKKLFFHTYQLITANGLATVSSDRVTIAPYPVDLAEPIPLSTRAVGASEKTEEDDVTEWVIERVMSHGKLDDGTQVVKIRWHGYTEAEDTWCSGPRSYLCDSGVESGRPTRGV